MTLADGTELSPALGVGAFIEDPWSPRGNARSRSDRTTRGGGPLVAALWLGSGGDHTGGVGRGMSVAVIGCGRSGVCPLSPVPLAGASKVIAVDVDDRKLQWARDMGPRMRSTAPTSILWKPSKRSPTVSEQTW